MLQSCESSAHTRRKQSQLFSLYKQVGLWFLYLPVEHHAFYIGFFWPETEDSFMCCTVCGLFHQSFPAVVRCRCVMYWQPKVKVVHNMATSHIVLHLLFVRYHSGYFYMLFCIWNVQFLLFFKISWWQWNKSFSNFKIYQEGTNRFLKEMCWGYMFKVSHNLWNIVYVDQKCLSCLKFGDVFCLPC